MPRAFITGITGQDGQHLAEFLHGKGYDVYGMVKGQNNPKAAQLVEQMPFVELVPGDLADLPSLVAAMEMSQPDEVYNLGALGQFPGTYGQARYGFAIGTASAGDLWLQNEAGVIMHLKAKRTGLMLSLGGDAVVISMRQ